jgi:hypothetical protein
MALMTRAMEQAMGWPNITSSPSAIRILGNHQAQKSIPESHAVDVEIITSSSSP